MPEVTIAAMKTISSPVPALSTLVPTAEELPGLWRLDRHPA
jgi:hypothetical protein